MFSGRKCHFLSFQVWLGRETRGCSPPRHEGEMGMNGERGGGEERGTERGMDGWIWGRRDAQPIRRLRKTRTFQAVQPPSTPFSLATGDVSHWKRISRPPQRKKHRTHLLQGCGRSDAAPADGGRRGNARQGRDPGVWGPRGVLHLLYVGPAGKPALKGGKKKKKRVILKKWCLGCRNIPIRHPAAAWLRPPSIVRERSAPD